MSLSWFFLVGFLGFCVAILIDLAYEWYKAVKNK